MTQETLARKLFLVLHDPFTGKPGVPIESLKYGLVTAALAELVIQRRLGFANDLLVPAGPRGNGADDVSALIAESVQREPGTSIGRKWVDGLTEIVYELVARALVAEGVVRREQGGRRMMRRSPDRFPALDLLRAAGPRIRFEHMLRSPGERDLPGAALAAVVHAFAMERVLDADAVGGPVRSSLSAAANDLPADVKNLVKAVASAVLTVSLDFRRL